MHTNSLISHNLNLIGDKYKMAQGRVLAAARAIGKPCTDVDIANELGITINRVSGRVGELIGCGELVECGVTLSEGKRPCRLVKPKIRKTIYGVVK